MTKYIRVKLFFPLFSIVRLGCSVVDTFVLLFS